MRVSLILIAVSVLCLVLFLSFQSYEFLLYLAIGFQLFNFYFMSQKMRTAQSKWIVLLGFIGGFLILLYSTFLIVLSRSLVVL